MEAAADVSPARLGVGWLSQAPQQEPVVRCPYGAFGDLGIALIADLGRWRLLVSEDGDHKRRAST